MKKLSFFLMAMLFSVMSFAAETVAYTLTTVSTGTGNSHTGYANAVDYTSDGITWNVTGNSNMVPWRIGGKSITNVDRAVYTKTALAADVTKIEITHGTVNCTLNSCTLIVSDAANEAGETFAVTVAQNTTSTITLPEGDYSNKFYKLVYNVTNTSGSNKFVQLSEIKFYTEVQTSIEAPTFTPEEGKVAANNTFAEPFALTIASATEGATIKYTLDGTDPALETALTYEAPITISTMVQVRAIAVKGEESSVEATATYIVASTEEKPYTASEAITAQSLGLAASVYVTGTVKTIEEISTQYGNATYNITDGVKELKIYRGKNLENAKFTSEDQLLVGDVVVVKGDLTSYNGAAQLGQNNYLISRIPAVVNYTIAVSANPAEGGVVTGGDEYEEGATATLTATANEGYEFVNWTENEVEVSTDAEYTFEVLADRALVANFEKAAPATETVYFVNAQGWTGTINAYAWTTDPNAAWPGAAATKEAEQIAGYDVYSYTAEAGKYANVIFNGTGGQTADLVWTAGKYYVLDGWYTKEEAEAKLATPIVDEVVYFVNNKNWSKVNAYAWDPANAAWPGAAATKEAEQIGGFDVYSYSAAPGTYQKVIFNDGGSNQTSDMVWTAGKYIVNNQWYTKEEAEAALAAPVVTTWTMVGDKALFGTDWDLNATANDLVKQEDGSWVLTLTNKTLAAKSYEYKAAKDRSWNTTVPGGDNAKLTISKAGQYDVTFTLNAAATSVAAKATYIPAKYNVTVTAENGTVEGAGEYEEGATATLTATAAEGYEFVNWTKGEEIVSTENPYTFNVTADVVLVANFKAVEPEVEWMPMELEINNLTTEVMEVAGAKYLMMMGGNEEMGESVTLFLNNYADVDDDYEVNAESSLIVYMGYEFTVMEGTISQTSETEKGTLYTGTVYAYTGSGDETMYAAFTLTMYATLPVEVEVTEATARVDEETGALVLNAEWTKDGVTYPVFVSVAGYEKGKEEYAGAQISELQIGDDDNWLDFAVANAVAVNEDGQDISIEGEYTSWNTGATYVLNISGKLPVVEPEVIAYELNGGELPTVEVPTNAELWEAFKPYYNTFYEEARADQPITMVATFMTQGEKIFTDATSEYKWLGDYLVKIATEQGYTINSEALWRWHADAFFQCNQHTAWPKSADFTEAGKPENWGAAYEAAHEVVLPTEPVAEDYVLPTPTKSGSTFKGWYDNAEGTGEAYTVIPAGWAGTLYAIWEQGTTTALENIAVEGKAVKAIINGQLIIIKNGVQYNAQGQVIK